MINSTGQQGVVLFLTLTILLLMTVSGVASIRIAMMQEHLSRNYRDVSMAFQSAESAILEAERFLEAAEDFNNFPEEGESPECFNGLCNSRDGSERFSTVDWSQGSDDYIPAAVTASDLGTANGPAYVIEHVARVSSAQDSLNITNVGEEGFSGYVCIFRITARGSGGADQSHAMIQVMYGRWC